MKILAIGGSTSKHSINKQLAVFAASLFKNAEVEVLDLNDYEMPLFSVDKEIETGPQEKARAFLQKIEKCDFIVLSLAEHNGSYSTAFKNLFDWSSRINGKPFQNKPMLLMATSPGARGGSSVLEAAKSRFPFMGGNIKATFSLPEFEKNFSPGQGVTNPAYLKQLIEIVHQIV